MAFCRGLAGQRGHRNRRSTLGYTDAATVRAAPRSAQSTQATIAIQVTARAATAASYRPAPLASAQTRRGQRPSSRGFEQRTRQAFSALTSTALQRSLGCHSSATLRPSLNAARCAKSSKANRTTLSCSLWIACCVSNLRLSGILSLSAPLLCQACEQLSNCTQYSWNKRLPLWEKGCFARCDNVWDLWPNASGGAGLGIGVIYSASGEMLRTELVSARRV